MRLKILARNVARLFGLLLVASIPLAANAQPVPREGDEVWSYLAKLPKDQRKAVLEREAAREGSFVLYGQVGIDRAAHVIKVFNDRYPNIRLDFVRQTAAEQSDKIMLEHRMNKMGGDVLLTDTSLFFVLKDAIAPFDPSSIGEFDPRFVYGGADKGWTAVVYELLPSVVAWRTDRVPSAEAPKTLEAVADPKWKGRVGTTTHLESFIEAMTGLYGKEAAETKARNLARLDNRLYRSQAALGEALASGAVDIAWNLPTTRADQMKSGGQPVDWVLQDPLFGIATTLTPLRLAKHPYAAALFVDFMLQADSLRKLEVAEGLKKMIGNLHGKYEFDVRAYPSLRPYPAIEEAKFKDLNLLAQKLFVRKEY